MTLKTETAGNSAGNHPTAAPSQSPPDLARVALPANNDGIIANLQQEVRQQRTLLAILLLGAIGNGLKDLMQDAGNDRATQYPQVERVEASVNNQALVNVHPDHAVPILVYDHKGKQEIVEVSLSQYEIYRRMEHPNNFPNNFPNYVTPNDPSIQDLSYGLTLGAKSKEEEAQKLLDYVHKIYYDKYEADNDLSRFRYPVETLFERTGDCEDASFLYASLLIAGDIDCVFLYYPGHVAVGVAGDFQGVKFNREGVDYFFTECTSRSFGPGDSQANYKLAIGEAWGRYTTAPAKVIECK